jgi:hypothetical protein
MAITKEKDPGNKIPGVFFMVILITKNKPADIDRYLRAAAETVLLFKIAYDIMKLLNGFLI